VLKQAGSAVHPPKGAEAKGDERTDGLRCRHVGCVAETELLRRGIAPAVATQRAERVYRLLSREFGRLTQPRFVRQRTAPEFLDIPLSAFSQFARHLVVLRRNALPHVAPLTLVLVMYFMPFMAVIFEINRDFHYQVPLSFDDTAMEVLDWLEECGLAWDMYVDLPASTVRYCFRTLEDATAFRQRFEIAPEGRAVVGH
jgi:hypothetical protein